ncbi:MAG: pilus assembly protein [Ketobacter sp.]|nr:MAG: pilus assembly protein [Ketobacter sp.]
MRMLNKAYGYKQAGVTMVETMLVMPIMLLIGFGIVHAGLVYQAQANLEYAALMAARVGAASNIDMAAMKKELEYRMRATSGVDGSDADVVTEELNKMGIEVLNPSYQMFLDCGQQPVITSGCAEPSNCEIPYFGMQFFDHSATICSNVSIQDANILRIRATYTYNSRIPFLNRIRFVGEGALPPEQDGITVSAVATVRMQSPARLSYDLLDSYNNASGGD